MLALSIQRNFGGQPLLLERMQEAMLPGLKRSACPLKELLTASLNDRTQT